MADPHTQLPPKLISAEPESNTQSYQFAHQAMATVFEIRCIHEDPQYAEQAARAAFDLVDRIETELTRYRGGSDISRINNLKSGETTSVGVWTMECLLLAWHLYCETTGAFDVSLGSGYDAVELLPADYSIRIHKDGVRVDLGGIGKGYAVDRAAELLEEWEVRQALLHAGFSSVLALDAPAGRAGWPLTISIPGTDPARVLARVTAREQAWSASGIRKKDHIMDPYAGVPVRNRQAAWVSGPLNALFATCQGRQGGDDSISRGAPFEMGSSPSAVADALSTAFMVMPLEEIAAYIRKYRGVEARMLIPDPSNPAAPPELIHYHA